MRILIILAAMAILVGCTPKEPVLEATTTPEVQAAQSLSAPKAIAEFTANDWLSHPNRVLDSATYASTFVGKKLVRGDSSFLMNEDGTITGSGLTSKKEQFTFSGNHAFEDGFYCRTNSVFNGSPMGDDCQVIVLLDASKYMLIRNRGEGEAVEYEIMGSGN